MKKSAALRALERGLVLIPSSQDYSTHSIRKLPRPTPLKVTSSRPALSSIAHYADSQQHARLANRTRTMTPNQIALLEIIAIALARCCE